ILLNVWPFESRGAAFFRSHLHRQVLEYREGNNTPFSRLAFIPGVGVRYARFTFVWDNVQQNAMVELPLIVPFYFVSQCGRHFWVRRLLRKLQLLVVRPSFILKGISEPGILRFVSL